MTGPGETSSPPATVEPAGGLRRSARLGWAVSDTAVITGRNLRHFVRQSKLLVLTTIQPVMFVVLFVFVFDGAIEVPTDSYIQYLLPGVLVQAVAFRSSQTAVGLAEDLARGVIDRFRTLPMARSAVLAGRTAADFLRNVFVVLLIAGVGAAIGFRFETGPGRAVAAFAVVSLFGFALNWMFAYVGLCLKGAEAAQSAGMVIMFPLVFASSVFVPVDSMPAWLGAFASWSPITHAADAARSLLTGGPALGSTLRSLLSITLMLGVFWPLAVRAYRRPGS